LDCWERKKDHKPHPLFAFLFQQFIDNSGDIFPMFLTASRKHPFGAPDFQMSGYMMFGTENGTYNKINFS
jgi:hypothetical protein